MNNQIINGDCIEELKLLEENSVDAIVTDPPYGISFMGKNWDHGVPGIPFWKEMLRVLKPGGFLLSFGGTRTYHRLACGIEDAGFEIRDCIQWLYGSGFPKSLNIGKQIDKIQGNEREIVGRYKRPDGTNVSLKGTENPCFASRGGMDESVLKLTKGNSEWEGWGTALKPACEPIVVARKPLSEKNVALNVLKWGTGGINIDACRVGNGEDKIKGGCKAGNPYHLTANPTEIKLNQEQGRFPANIILDEEAGKILDEQAPETGAFAKVKSGQKEWGGEIYHKFETSGDDGKTFYDKGKRQGASRFFYCAKASKSERNYGCEEMEQKDMRYEDGSAKSMEIFSNQYTESSGNPTGRGITSKRANNHPTVKPIKLMEYLIKLVSKEGAVVLDPFLGSGTTLLACYNLNRKGIGIEKEEEYVKIAQARLNKLQEQRKLISK